MPDHEDDEGRAFPEGHAFRMELYSNRGDAMEKMGRRDPGEKGFLRRALDVIFRV